MDFSEQFPIVFQALNVGFLQTLKLFFVTLLGAIPLGLIISFGSMSRFAPLKYLTKIIVWIIRGTPLMIQSGTGIWQQYMGRRRVRPFSRGICGIYF